MVVEYFGEKFNIINTNKQIIIYEVFFFTKIPQILLRAALARIGRRDRDLSYHQWKQCQRYDGRPSYQSSSIEKVLNGEVTHILYYVAVLHYLCQKLNDDSNCIDHFFDDLKQHFKTLN